MIEELTILSFSKYGMPVYFNKSHFTADFTAKKYQLQPGVEQRLFRYAGDVYLEPLRGVGVLYVQSETGAVKEFLLDKKTKVNGGVWMCAAAYACEFTYIAYAASTREFQAEGEVHCARPLSPALRVDSLLTAMYQDKGLDYNRPAQKFPFWEFLYMDKGGMECIAEGKAVLLSQGECLFFPPGSLHAMHAADSRSFSFFTVTFSMDFSGEGLSGRVLRVDDTSHKLLTRMIEESHRQQAHAVDLLCAYMAALCIQLLRAQEQKGPPVTLASTLTRNSLNATVEKCIGLIDENISGDLSVPQLAKYLNVSPSYLSKVFRDETNVSLSEYIRDYRLEKSKELIREGNYSLSQIADMLGYCSIHYFSAQFKARYGIPPREYSRAAMQD